MISTLRRLHIWAGLFTFTALLVMAVAGLNATLRPYLGGEPVVEVREIPYLPDPTLADAAVAAELARELDLPLPEPLPRGALRRNDRHELELRLDSENGSHLVTLLEPSGTVRVERRRNSLGDFLSLLHARTFVGTRGPLPVHLWALYVDLSIASLLFLVGSGFWLWLSSRPRRRWAGALLAAGILLFAGLWWAIA